MGQGSHNGNLQVDRYMLFFFVEDLVPKKIGLKNTFKPRPEGGELEEAWNFRIAINISA